MTTPKFQLGDYVEKISGSAWIGRVVGTYSTKLTPEGYAVESLAHYGSVQIYPASALRPLEVPEHDDRQQIADDIALFGSTFVRDGKRIDPDDVWLPNDNRPPR